MTQFNLSPEEARSLVADALESGDYEQGKGWLERDGKLCCLGVACRIFQEKEGGLNIGPEGGEWVDPGWPDVDPAWPDGEHHGAIAFNGETSHLPYQVRDWLGFRLSTGEWNLDEPIDINVLDEEGDTRWVTALTTANDDGMLFKDIADFFRDPPPKLLGEGEDLG